MILQFIFAYSLMFSLLLRKKHPRAMKHPLMNKNKPGWFVQSRMCIALSIFSFSNKIDENMSKGNINRIINIVLFSCDWKYNLHDALNVCLRVNYLYLILNLLPILTTRKKSLIKYLSVATSINIKSHSWLIYAQYFVFHVWILFFFFFPMFKTPSSFFFFNI
jgi:hypothetical protein